MILPWIAARAVDHASAPAPCARAVCDPVQGDDGRLYCHAALPAAFRQDIVPLASVLTPNQFEVELLTGQEIRSEAGALAACAALHARGPATVVITSLALPGAEEFVTILASTTAPQQGGGPQRLRMRVPRVHAYFTGTGEPCSRVRVQGASCQLARRWRRRRQPHTTI